MLKSFLDALLNAMSDEMILTTARKVRRNWWVYSEWTQKARTINSNSNRQEGIRYGKGKHRTHIPAPSPDD